MTMQFDSQKQAKDTLLFMCGLNPETAEVEEAAGLQVADFGTMLLDDPDTPDEVKEGIRKRIANQKGYKVQTPKGELRFVIDPFRKGFCCWVVGNNGFAQRL